MQDWFKARNLWGASIDALSDEEAGRLAKAMWAYTMRGEMRELSGAAGAVFALILMTLQQDEQAMTELSQKRAEAGAKGGKQTQANASKAKQTEANQANADNKIKNKNKSIDKDIDINTLVGFDEFWQAYPKKTGKGEARKAWAKIRPDAELLQQILAAVEWQSKCDQWQRDNGQYIPYPATWLNQQRWEDEDVQITSKRNKSVMMGKKDESSFEAWKSALRKVPMN